MRVPLSWLRDYVAFDATCPELAERLTFSGMEVEAIETIDGNIPGVVAAEVLSVEPHPNEEGLRVCRVNAGAAAGELVVVCGAPDAVKGVKAPLALPGTRLPSGQLIGQASVRGVVSQGMLCAEDELGLFDDHEGLMHLPADAKPGTELGALLGGTETVLVLEITPNRSDCLSMIGVAREVAALYGGRIKLPAAVLAESDSDIAKLASVRIEDEQGCPRYTLRALTGAKVGSSPFWLRRRLALAGVRPINNLVDVTNYVMLECGQPLHAFDARRIEGRVIRVRRAAKNESLRTLDDVERPLSSEVLVIADATRPVAVAGVMGGDLSGIADDTSEVWLESACFQPARVRAGARQLGMATESSRRFERGVDILLAEWASRRAACMMAEFAGAVPAHGLLDSFPVVPPERFISCHFDKVNNLLGVDVPPDRVCDIFESLLLKVTDRDKNRCVVKAPTFRQDLEIEADLIEEVARIHGLDQIKTHAPIGRLVPEADDTPSRAHFKACGILAGLGLSEVYHYSMTSAALLDMFGAAQPQERVALPNPISQDQALLRPSLLPQLTATLGYNRARQIAEGACFEIGRVFFRKPGAAGLGEEERLAIGLMGPVGRQEMEKRRPWNAQEMFLWIKGIFENTARALHAKISFLEQTDSSARAAAPIGLPWDALASGCRAWIVVDNKVCGAAGILRRELAAEWRLSAEPPAIAELALAPLLEKAFETPIMSPLPAHPCVVRDVAMALDCDVRHERIIEVIQKVAPDILTDIKLFDMYMDDKKVGMGRKSVAYSLTYRSTERTLTDEDVNNMHLAVVNALKSELKAEIREG